MAHIRRDITDDATTIDAYLESATDFAEQYQNRCLCQAEWEASYDYFPATFYLPVPPLFSVDEITYVDTAGVTQTLDADVYVVDAISQPGRVALAFGQTWPSTQSQIGSVTVAFTAGYASESLIPARARQAIRMLTAHMYEHRGDEAAASTIPVGVMELLDADKLLNYR